MRNYDQSLRHQQPVERIRMMPWQPFNRSRMLRLDSKQMVPGLTKIA